MLAQFFLTSLGAALWGLFAHTHTHAHTHMHTHNHTLTHTHTYTPTHTHTLSHTHAHIHTCTHPLPQVVVSMASNITAANSTFTCPVASHFSDSLGGLFGPGAIAVPSGRCGDGRSLLISTLQFQCEQCGEETYSLLAGSSGGSPGDSTAFPCLPCPDGGRCLSGALVASAGHWGAVVAPRVPPASASSPSPTVVFALCPEAYCCDGTPTWPCDTINACGGRRIGVLCGDCPSGYVESVGSAVCVEEGQCAKDAAVVWSFLVVGLVVAAVLQLAVVSDVWFPSKDAPSARLKLVIYFAQVRARKPLACVHVHIVYAFTVQTAC